MTHYTLKANTKDEVSPTWETSWEDINDAEAIETAKAYAADSPFVGQVFGFTLERADGVLVATLTAHPEVRVYRMEDLL